VGDSIAVDAVDEQAAREILADLERREEEARKEEEKKEIESTKAPGQVVDLEKPRQEVRPDQAKFAAEHDSTVERQTRRITSGEGPTRPAQLAMRAPAEQAQPQPPSRPSQPSPPSPPRAPAAPARPGASLSGQDVETEAGPPPGPDQREATPGAPPSPGATPPRPAAVALMPTQETIARAIGGGSADHLPDIDEGDDTALNAKKWKFASFFNRVKEQIRQHWRAASEYRKRDPTGELYGGRARFTLLRVQLKPDGSLSDVYLEKGSGVDFLDDVAVEAVKEAQPFPNPPQQLVDQTGLISFRFGFIVDVEGGAKLKVYRYSSM
jgi:TonB family protein